MTNRTSHGPGSAISDEEVAAVLAAITALRAWPRGELDGYELDGYERWRRQRLALIRPS